MSACPASGWPGRAVPAACGVDAGQMLYVTPLAGGGGLHLAGEVDISSVGLLERALDDVSVAVADGEIVLEMGEVSFVDVAGARAVARAAGRLTAGRRLVLRHPPRVLLLVLEFFPDSRGRIEVIPR